MDQLKSIKLSLIKKILQCHDPQILHTVDQILELEKPKPQDSEELIAVSTSRNTEDIEEVQRYMEEVFNSPNLPQDPFPSKND